MSRLCPGQTRQWRINARPVTSGWAQREPLGFRFACYALHGVSVRPHSQHSHEMQVEEPVQGPSHSGGVRALVSMELSASNERLDFAFP